MPNENDQFEKLIFNHFRQNKRFTQDSPVYPDVWRNYYSFEKTASQNLDNHRVDLILTPHRDFSASLLLKTLRERLILLRNSNDGIQASKWRLATTGESVAACLTLKELLLAVLPLSAWWRKNLWHDKTESEDLTWLKQVVGAIYWAHLRQKRSRTSAAFLAAMDKGEFIEKFQKNFPLTPTMIDEKLPTILWSVSVNRKATVSISESVPATKADAGCRLFNIYGAGITWAVIDTGIDVRHKAFRRIDPEKGSPYEHPDIDNDPSATGSNFPQKIESRVVASYDFTMFRKLMAGLEDHISEDTTGDDLHEKLKTIIGTTSNSQNAPLTPREINSLLQEMANSLKNGRSLDWSVIGPLLRISHNTKDYRAPIQEHGTHVAGIMAADMSVWGKEAPVQLTGMCPGIELYDLRVFDDEGEGDKFGILAALQFVRWLNKQKDQLVIHGVNLSLSISHQVSNFACGRTPVCEECQRMVAEGIVVVAAAGNEGQAIFQSANGSQEGFRSLNITDPGNAESVITVGATHRNKPHTYGVSYFSSKGPTGDGRYKPDLVAPGEKITSTIPGNAWKEMDGTSMAAPHVSGAAALLLARYRELIGQPLRIKALLCENATDLGRERYFQGCGMLDVLRAMQAV